MPTQDTEEPTLDAMIKASQEVRQRLQILAGFDEIIFGDDWRKRLRERTQLHRLLVHHLWLFGEEYHLDTDDDRLRKVLERHLHHLGRELLAEEANPTLIDGRDAIPDLMLSRKFERDRGQIEHLVLELKRPSVRLGAEAITQIKQYAHAVKDDERFSTSKVRWIFALVGNSFDSFGELEASPSDRPYGCIDKREGLEIWMWKWSDVLHDARHRYSFFQKRLEIEARGSEGVQLLKSAYPLLMSGKGLTKKQENELREERFDT